MNDSKLILSVKNVLERVLLGRREHGVIVDAGLELEQQILIARNVREALVKTDLGVDIEEQVNIRETIHPDKGLVGVISVRTIIADNSPLLKTDIFTRAMMVQLGIEKLIGKKENKSE